MVFASLKSPSVDDILMTPNPQLVGNVPLLKVVLISEEVVVL